jgi:hypothetical protein
LTRRELAVVVSAEHLPERRQIAEQGSQRVHVLDEPPELGEVVLDGRGRQEQDGHAAREQDLAHAPGRSRLGGLVVVLAELIEALVNAGEDLVRFVDDAKIERFGSEKCVASFLATGRLAPHEENPFPVEPTRTRLALARLDVEQLEQLLTPLTEKGLGRNQQDPTCTFRQQLRDDEPRFDRFSEAHLVGKNATPFANAGEGEDDGCDLVGVGVDLRRALRRSVPTLLVGASQPNEVLGAIATLSRVERTGGPVQRGHCRLQLPSLRRGRYRKAEPGAPRDGGWAAVALPNGIVLRCRRGDLQRRRHFRI